MCQALVSSYVATMVDLSTARCLCLMFDVLNMVLASSTVMLILQYSSTVRFTVGRSFMSCRVIVIGMDLMDLMDLSCHVMSCRCTAGYLQQKGVSGSTRTVYEEACSEMDTINE